MITHFKTTIPGLIGNATAGGAFTIAYLTDDVIPVLHAISLVAGIVAAFATAAYYIREMWKKNRK